MACAGPCHHFDNNGIVHLMKLDLHQRHPRGQAGLRSQLHHVSLRLAKGSHVNLQAKLGAA